MHLMGECGEVGRELDVIALGRRRPSGGNLYLYKILSV